MKTHQRLGTSTTSASNENPAVILLTESAVSVSSLVVTRKDVADYLSRLPESEREEQLIRAIEVGVFCLERAAATQDTEFVRRQIDSLLNQVQAMVAKVPEQTEKALLNKIGSNDGQVLAPIKQAVGLVQETANEKIQEVKALLEQDLDPTRQTTTLGKALVALRDLLDPKRTDSVQGHLHEAVRNITKADGDLANTVKTLVEQAIKPLALSVNELAKEVRGKEAAEEVAQQTTLKGYDFEDQVVDRIRQWAAMNGFEVEHVGSDNQPGDVVVKVASDAGTPDLVIVVEAKDRAVPVGRKHITEAIEGAMDKRMATCGIWVSKQPEGFANEIGEWGEGQCGHGRWVACTFDLLLIALRFGIVQHRMAVLRAAQPEVEADSIADQAKRIRTALGKVGNITRKVTDVRTAADDIQEHAEALRDEIKEALTAIEDNLRSAQTRKPAGDIE